MSKRNNYRQLACLFAEVGLAALTTNLWAAGFQLMEQSGNLSTAYAGTASLAEDASTNFYNAAGLVRNVLPCEQLVGSAVLVIPHAKLTATSATATFGPANIAPGVAKNHPVSLVPALHYLYRFDDCWAFGVSATSPFGLKVRYKDDSVARYMVTRAEIRTYDISPSIAFNFGRGFSLGAGLDIVHALAKLDAQVGTGSILTDGYQENTASDWGLGGHIGALFEVSDCTRFGINFRSKIKIHADGESISAVPGPGPETRQGLKARTTLPETWVISAYHDITDCWAVMLDIQRTNWKKFNELTLRFADGRTSTTVYKFKSSTRYALGTSFQVDDCWRLRLGVAYDQSPVRNAFRTVGIPDSNRTWAAIGAQYRFYKCLAVELGYAHLFFKKASINQPAPTVNFAPAPQNTLQGRYKARADLIGLQVTWDIA